MSTDYVQDTLSDDDLDAIALVVNPKTVLAMRNGTTTDRQKVAIKRVQLALTKAPPLTTSITLYKGFKASAGLIERSKVMAETGHGILEEAFLTGTKTNKTDSQGITLAISVSAGTKVLELPEGAYILDRGSSLFFDPPSGNTIKATLAPDSSDGSEALSIDLPETNTTRPGRVEEFYNKVHGKDGRFGSGKSGSGGAKAAAPPVDKARQERMQQRQRIKRNQKIMTAVRLVVAVSFVAGVVISNRQRPTQPSRPNRSKPQTTKRYVPEQKGRPMFPDRSDNPKYGLPMPGQPWNIP